MKTVKIIIEGGVVVECKLPEDTRLVICDYDADEETGKNIHKDKNGKIYRRIVYEKK